jgi:Phage ABA sandwich domain
MIDDIDKIEAGPELDGLIAIRSLGWVCHDWPSCKGVSIWRAADGHNTGYDASCVPNESCEPFEPSTDITAAWLVVEKFDNPHWDISISTWQPGWQCHIEYTGGVIWEQVKVWEACGKTAMLALCRCALKVSQDQP